MSTEAEDEKKLKIVDLNDDCLIEVTKHLNSKDLMALFEAHDRFHTAIGSVVSHRCIVVETDSDLEIADKFFKKFGAKMRTLRISNATALRQLMKYLNGGQIENCELESVFSAGDPWFAEENLTFFTTLEVLKLSRIDFTRSDYEQIFNVITQVRTLDLNTVYFAEEVTIIDVLTKIRSFNRLRTFSLIRCGFEIEGNRGLLPANTTIEELTWGPHSLEFAILNHFPNVRSLRIEFLNETFEYEPLEMDNLKKLSLSYFNEESLIDSLLSTLAQSNGLDCLELEIFSDEKLPDILKSVAEMTNLKELCLELRVEYAVDITEFARNLKQLRQFSFQSQGHVEEAKVCEFVQLVPGLKSFRVARMSCDGSIFVKLSEIRKNQNSRDILEVEILNSMHDGPVSKLRNNYVKMKMFN